MKVLMFGWEFPPHISGGLGTACYGLTKSLMNEKVKVLFVVPRLFGDESARSGFLINASATTNGSKTRRRGTVRSRTAAMTAIREDVSGRAQRHTGGMTYLEVPSSLSPYQVSHPSGFSRETTHFTSWNYSITRNTPGQGSTYLEHVETEMDNFPDGTGEAVEFTFSGTYGKNLMEEVKRYGQVAGRIACKYAFDVIHVHDWMTFPAGITAKKKSDKPLIVHVHSTEFDRSGKNLNYTILDIEKLGLAAADKIIAVSNWTKQIIVSRYGIPEHKVAVVHNGVLPKSTPEVFDFPDIASHFVTFLGRVTHQKGPRFFVEAARKVLDEYPDAHFIVAGAGDLLPQIIERVAHLNMSASFHFTGFLSGDQVDRVWSMTDVYVMPSVSEPFGIAPLEAIQGGVPVILSNQSGVAEVMPHAIKVDFWDTKALAAAICSVLRYESLSQVLRQNSKRHIEHLTWDKAALEVKALYDELRRKK